MEAPQSTGRLVEVVDLGTALHCKGASASPEGGAPWYQLQLEFILQCTIHSFYVPNTLSHDELSDLCNFLQADGVAQHMAAARQDTAQLLAAGNLFSEGMLGAWGSSHLL
jgi:hypothetical protein